MWYRLMPVIVAGEFQQYRVFVVPVSLLILAAALFSLAALLVRDTALMVCSMIATGFMPYALSFPSGGIAWGVVVATALLLPFAASYIRKEMESSVRYRVSKFIKQGLGIYFTATALVFSLFYLQRIDNGHIFSILFPQPLFDVTLRAFSGTIQEVTGLPKIQPEQTVNEVLAELVQSQLKSQGLSPEKIPQKEFNRLLAAERAEFAKTYHIALGGGEKIGTVFAHAVTSKIKDTVGSYNRYLPLVAAVAFFFAFKALSILFRVIAIALAVLLMKLLVLVKVVKKEKEQLEVERLVL